VKSQRTFEAAKAWLTECMHDCVSHSQCLQKRNDFAPTRLIEVLRHLDGKLTARLVQDLKGDRIRWACLSYCWGGDQPSKTTKANFTERLETLPLVDLPKTITDVIPVTSQMDIRYLWIDALCIIPDNPDDVACEIASMPEVYMHGVCTISASQASTSVEGFLQDHQTDEMHHQPIPIHKRAWCYQERILSSRIVDFGHTQIQWICKSKRDADDGRVDRAAITDALIESSVNNLLSPQERWFDVVSKYTRRDMTFVGDRVLAVSAVAAYFALQFDCEYVAGFWKDKLALQLAWIAGRPKYSRPGIYIAPSWQVRSSWACISDSVFWTISDDLVPAVEVVDCRVHLRHSFAPFGAVTNGYLLLRAQIREM
ncbi:HET-domain-containing protein, partial [Setomelanomma holmii]